MVEIGIGACRKKIGNAVEHFRRVLSKLHPIEWTELSWDAPRPQVCFRFFRPAPNVYLRIGEAVAAFQGRVHWTGLAGKDCYCIGASLQRSVAYHPLKEGDVEILLEAIRRAQNRTVNPDLLLDAAADVPALCDHLLRSLGLQHAPSQTFDPRLLEISLAEETREGHFSDFIEPSTHLIWLVQDPEAFGVSLSATSAQDRRLHFGLSGEEWSALFRILRTDMSPHATGGGKTIGQPQESAGVMDTILLQRMEDYLSDAVFLADEASCLRKECEHVLDLTTDRSVQRGLDKLVYRFSE